MPLFVEALQVLVERGGYRAQGRGQSSVMSLAEADRHHKFAVHVRLDLPGQGNVAIERGAELPIHLEVVHQVLPAVALPT